MKYLIYIILLHGLFATSVVTMNQTRYNISDFYNEYGKKEWEQAKPQHREELVNDFINRRLATIEATNLGFKNNPDITKKLYNGERLILINTTYEELVAKPLVSKELLDKTRRYISEERLLSHIVISHKNSKIQNPPTRTVDEAFLLAQKISNEIKTKEEFIDSAIKYSEDPTVFQNEGRLDWITWGRTIPAFQEAAFILKKGDISRPVLTDFGYHIIFCEDIRLSEYASLDKEGLEKIIYDVSLASIREKLRPAALEYDSTKLSNARIQYNDDALVKIINAINKQNEKNKISGQYKVDLIDLFNKIPNVGAVVVFNNKGYGLKWFGEKLTIIPTGRHPIINDENSLKQAFNTIILQDIAINDGYENNIEETLLYKKQIAQLEQSLLYDYYLKWLMNNAPSPDSLAIHNYYNLNKDEKYIDGNKVSVREIRVLNKELADSLLLELQYGANFEKIAKEYSKTNPGSGGLIPPFTQGKYNQMGEIAFNLEVGELSDVIMNLDRTYSIIKLEERIDSGYIPINKVYNRIDSIIKRQNQTQAREDGLKTLRQKYNVIINTSVYNN